MSKQADTTDILINIVKAAAIIIIGFILIRALIQAV
jgi:hypothetical protein